MEARRLDTEELRENFLVTGMFSPGQVRLTYSHLDRTIIGGAMPAGDALQLGSEKQVGSDPFLARREMGVFNIGGPGTVVLDGREFELAASDCLYVPMGVAEVRFSSADAGMPAKFYLVSVPAHAAHEPALIGIDAANRLDLGAQPGANRRILRQYIHPDICKSCQLVMGMTFIEDGSVWNTMPCHTHDRRSEFYLYFDMAAETRIFHFMGEPSQTRHLVVENEQAVISPGWSIHCGAGTGRYAFIWSMAGDNQDFTDMDMVAMGDLR
ncbi:MAG: 5-dehydro-4-deoxy-D-glucuronate isomerase [Pseudomonadota bacterium]|nr:5-dehydro-4-deoxy-D-glucuronate isomerase [Pseudomonadota bacterium]